MPLLCAIIAHLWGTVIGANCSVCVPGAEQNMVPALRGHPSPCCSSEWPLSIPSHLSQCLDCTLQHLSWGGSGRELLTPGRNSYRQLSSRGDVHIRGQNPSLPLQLCPSRIPSCCRTFGITPGVCQSHPQHAVISLNLSPSPSAHPLRTLPKKFGVKEEFGLCRAPVCTGMFTTEGLKPLPSPTRAAFLCPCSAGAWSASTGHTGNLPLGTRAVLVSFCWGWFSSQCLAM